MSEQGKQPYCPECAEGPEGMDRRGFIGQAATLLTAGAAAGVAPRVLADQPAATTRAAKPAEAMILELYNGLNEDQKRQVVYPWNHGAGENQQPTRSRMFNSAFASRIGQTYSRPQQELVERILKSICSGDDGFRQISRGGTWDGSQSFDGCGAYIFGNPTNNQQYSWVFMGHHLTVRCDGNSETNAAFGGPMYYGHSPDGYSQRNIFFYQTRSALDLFESLTEGQRNTAVVGGSPGEQYPSVRFRAAGQPYPGIAARDLTQDQRRLVETVMRQVLSPYRREDADEVMQIIRRNGGLERLHMAYYGDRAAADANRRWSFWRIEGPGFVWNFRVLPHVHTFVNIAAQA